MATGLGKSIVIAELIRQLLALYPDIRILVLVHVRELVAQNVEALRRVWSGAPIGVNSAGLGKRERQAQVLFASIQSVYREDGFSLGPRDLVLIDEAHLVPRSGQGMYLRLLAALRRRCPDLRLVGLTATPYRLDSGRLDEGDDRLFETTVYSYDIGRGVADGWLAPLVSKGTATDLNVSGVRRRGGEFVAGELERAVDQADITAAAAREIVDVAAGRRSWLVFCAGVDHALHARDALLRLGVPAATITGQTPPREREHLIASFRAGTIRALTNANVLVTGFDAPAVDTIAMLRPTLSPGLYTQMLGRGTRPIFSPDADLSTTDGRRAAIAAGPKPNCLVLDFAKNIRRHGPVDRLSVTVERSAARVDSVEAKQCPECRGMVALGVMVCDQCGYEWPKKAPPKIAAVADTAQVMGGDAAPGSIRLGVRGMQLFRHQKLGKRDTLRVVYAVTGGSGFSTVAEWLSFETSGYARRKAEWFWRELGGRWPIPATIDDALDRRHELATPTEISIRPGPEFCDVLSRRTAEARRA